MEQGPQMSAQEPTAAKKPGHTQGQSTSEPTAQKKEASTKDVRKSINNNRNSLNSEKDTDIQAPETFKAPNRCEGRTFSIKMSKI